jgi:hypothetical protein
VFIPGECRVLDRQKLEAGEQGPAGRVGPHGGRWWRGYFSLSAFPEGSQVKVPGLLKDSLEVLGLTRSCDAANVKRAYRQQSKLRHPDAGGSHEEFLALGEAYQLALGVCRSQGQRPRASAYKDEH